MTKCKYSELPNAELDRLVAERVLGWKVYKAFEHSDYTRWEPPDGLYHLQLDGWDKPPKIRFTTSMDACLSYVVPEMFKRKCNYEFSQFYDGGIEFYWWYGPDGKNQFLSTDKSLPRATCIAALLALDAINKTQENEHE